MSFVDVQLLGCGDAFGTGGRFNTCFHVKGANDSFLIDCGASSLIALKKFNVDPNNIDTIFLSHLHGDHFAGVVFFLMDARYLAARTKPLTVAGPKGVKNRVIDAMNVLYPGCWDKGLEFDLEFVELEKGQTQTFNGVNVLPFSARHLQDGNDFIFRFGIEDKIISFSGDTGWTEDLVHASQNADLLLCECFHYDTKCEFHMDYETIIENRQRLSAKNIYLTHLGPQALEKHHQMALPVSFDGMKISL